LLYLQVLYHCFNKQKHQLQEKIVSHMVARTVALHQLSSHWPMSSHIVMQSCSRSLFGFIGDQLVKEVGTPDPSQTKIPSVMLSEPPSQSDLFSGYVKKD
jgi:hypothetical protein